MAERSLNVSLKIGGAVQASVGSAFGKVRQEGVRTAKEIANASRAANKATRQQLHGQMLAVAAPVLALALPVKQAIAFETAMAGVKKVVNFDTPAGLKEMGAAVLKLTTDKRLPMTAVEIADIMAAAGQAGVARGELLQFAESAAEMGIAFDMSAQDAGEGMAFLRNTFSLGQSDVVLLGDAFNTLGNRMAAKSRDLVNISNRVGKFAVMAGLTGAQVGAMGATLLDAGTDASTSATTMNDFIGSLYNAERGVPNFQDALKKLGMSGKELSANMRDDAQGTIIKFLETVKSSKDPLAALSAMFGPEYAKQVAKLAGGLDKYKFALGLVGDETKYAGAMHKEYEDLADTTGNSIKILKNQANRLAIGIGGALLPATNDGVGGLGKMLTVVTNLVEKYPGLTRAVGLAAAGLVTFKLVSLSFKYAGTIVSDMVATMRQGFASLQPTELKKSAAAASKSIQAIARGAGAAGMGLIGLAGLPLTSVTAGFWAMTTAVLSNPITWIVVGIALAALLIYRYWEPIKAFFGGLWTGIKAAFTPVGEALKEIFAPLEPVITSLKNAFTPLKDAFMSLFGPAETSATTLKNFTSAGEKVGSVIGTVLAVGLWPFIMAFEGIGYAIEAVTAVFQSADPLGLIKKTFSEVWDWLMSFNLFEAGAKIMSSLGSGIKSMGSSILGSVTGLFSKNVEPALPKSDAKIGPLSKLTASGHALVTTLGQGISQAGQDALAGPLMSVLGVPMPPVPMPALAGALPPGATANPLIKAPVATGPQIPLPALPGVPPPAPGAPAGAAGGGIHIDLSGMVINANTKGDAQAIGDSLEAKIRKVLESVQRRGQSMQRGALHDGDRAGLASL